MDISHNTISTITAGVIKGLNKLKLGKRQADEDLPYVEETYAPSLGGAEEQDFFSVRNSSDEYDSKLLPVFANDNKSLFSAIQSIDSVAEDLRQSTMNREKLN